MNFSSDYQNRDFELFSLGFRRARPGKNRSGRKGPSLISFFVSNYSNSSNNAIIGPKIEIRVVKRNADKICVVQEKCQKALSSRLIENRTKTV